MSKNKMQQKLFSLQKKLKVKMGLQKRYNDQVFNNGKWSQIYHFDLHIEDLENGIAPESPRIFISDFSIIDQRNLDQETVRGWH